MEYQDILDAEVKPGFHGSCFRDVRHDQENMVYNLAIISLKMIPATSCSIADAFSQGSGASSPA
jgi:hypothetical protein